MKTKTNDFTTSRQMLEWQYYQILGELIELQRHASDPTCPCRLSKDLGENCLAKHSLGLSVIASETAAMDSEHRELLMDLSAEAKERHEGMKAFLCDKEDEPEFQEWSRQWRKRIEPLYYYGACPLEMHAEHSEVEVPQPVLMQSGRAVYQSVCTPAQKERRERCILHVKAANNKRGCCKPDGNDSKTCPNPFAVCNKSVGCRIGKAS